MLNPMYHAEKMDELLTNIVDFIYCHNMVVVVMQTLPKINYEPQSEVLVLMPSREFPVAFKETILKYLIYESQIYGAQQQIDSLEKFLELLKESTSELARFDVIYLTKFTEDFPNVRAFKAEVINYESNSSEVICSEIFQRLNKKLYIAQAEELQRARLLYQESLVREVERAKAEVRAHYDVAEQVAEQVDNSTRGEDRDELFKTPQETVRTDGK